jgi:hypothetical protein
VVIGRLEEFARRVSEELQEPSWETRREVVRALVKRVEVDEQEVRIVYRVSPSPFEGRPQQGSLLHCWGRVLPVSWILRQFASGPEGEVTPGGTVVQLLEGPESSAEVSLILLG